MSIIRATKLSHSLHTHLATPGIALGAVAAHTPYSDGAKATALA